MALGAEAAELYERYVARYILARGHRCLSTPFASRKASSGAGCCLRNRPRGSRCGRACRFRRTCCWCRPESRRDRRCAIAPRTGRRADRMASRRDAPSIFGLMTSALDVVLCQQGLRPLPDKAAAPEGNAPRAQSMAAVPRLERVGQRWALQQLPSVRQPPAQFLGNETAVPAFVLRGKAPTREELQRLPTKAGFSAVDVRLCRINAHLPRLDEFTLNHLAATPVGPVIAAADPEVRKKIESPRDESAAALRRRRWGYLPGGSARVDGSGSVTPGDPGSRGGKHAKRSGTRSCQQPPRPSCEQAQLCYRIGDRGGHSRDAAGARRSRPTQHDPLPSLTHSTRRRRRPGGASVRGNAGVR